MSKHENQYLLRILDEVSRDGDLTQRSLSRRLGVALGLTNLYVKRLAKKGLIKVVNIKPNRLRYELTPSGIHQKATLALQYIHDSYAFYREARNTISGRFRALQREGVKAVAFYGTEDVSEIAFLSLQEVGLRLAAVVNPDQVGQAFCGHVVADVEALQRVAWDRLVVMTREQGTALAQLKAIGIDRSRVVFLGEGQGP